VPHSSRWYKDAVIYEAHVRAFADSNGDGIGDFPGLTGKLDYLQALGINTLWLLPFYPSPLRDDGYDIADYEAIHPAYGTLQEFDRFVDEAHRRGIRVITELVVNHTSDQHPWFQAARRAPAGSPERDFYVWSDTKQKYQDARIIFSDTETSNWSWDDAAGAYYWHRFFHHQPDLNFDNPRVFDAVARTMRFWLDRGVDGMRLDAVPYLIERDGTSCENLEETHTILRRLRAAMDERYPDRMLIAEANQWPADVRPYFGDGDECHMAFHFPLMPRMFMAIQQEDRHPITEILRQTPDLPDTCQWGLFLRNHDELTLETVTDEERDYMYQAYAADPRMRINAGIRRRLAPLVENSRRRIELLHMLLFSLPGTPVIYYGDEIGMGDNIYLGDRNGVRTPMQWTGDRNAGFSRGDPASLYAPLIMDPVYGYQAINVESQEGSPFSLLNWMRRLIALRRQSTVFGRGTLQFLHPANRKVLAYVRRHDDEQILCVANLSRSTQPVELDLSPFKGLTPVEMLGLTEFPRVGDLPYFLTLPGYYSYWFRLQPAAAPIAVQRVKETPAPAETPADALPAFFMGVAWDTLLDGNVRTLIEREALGPFLQRQPWFGGASRALRAARFVDWGLLRRGPHPIFIAIVQADYQDGGREQYFVPLALVDGAHAASVLSSAPHGAVARITGARKGLVVDGAADEATLRALLEIFDRQDTGHTRRGTVRIRRTPAFAQLRGDGDLAPRQLGTGQAGTTIAFGDRMIATLFRRVEPGPNPGVEIAEHLTTKTTFRHAPRAGACLEYEPAGEPPATHLAGVSEFVKSQADGWHHALAELDRFYDDVLGRPGPQAELVPSQAPLELAMEPIPPAMCELSGLSIDGAQQLGRRTAELHLALASAASVPAFAPAAFTQDNVARLAAQASGRLASLRDALDAGVATRLERRLQALRDGTRGPLTRLNTARTRIHGNLHLGHVLWSEGDFYLIDFDGDPARPLEERRGTDSPLRDVASLLRSYAYAAYAALLARGARPAEETDRLESWARAWQKWVGASFLKGYLASAGAAPFLPEDPVQRTSLLDLFLIDRALHELKDEIDRRPDWARIPVRGLMELA
jgi:maltose alpha-D-glucosyltransferase/alpha-amylase